MIEIEQNTLNGINELRKSDKPFAAAILCYVLIERCLKIFLLENRSTITESDIDFNYRVKKAELCFRDCLSFKDDDFILKFLSKCPLGALETLFRIKRKKIADHRNDLIHSSIYLVCQTGESNDFRRIDNYSELDKATEFLIYTSVNCFKNPISKNIEGNLVFKS